MQDQSKKFLEFNGKTIYFLAIDGKYWIAIKPICEALGINYDRQYKNLLKHRILSGVYAKQHMHDSSGRLQQMISLPEEYIYGWIFSINSDSEELARYQDECYHVLFHYFHGAITRRTELLVERTHKEQRIAELKAVLEATPEFKELQDLEAEKKKIPKALSALDEQILKESQLSLL